MRKFFKLILIFILLLVNTTVYAADSQIPVRVGISNTGFNTYLFDEIEIINADEINVMDSATGYIVPSDAGSKIVKVTSEDNLFRVYIDGELKARNLTGPILITPKKGDLISIAGLKRKGQQASYRGYIELTRSSKDISKFAIVNVLSLKNYLRGVVPNEMPVRFGLEALKAQTVAARNYAVAPRVRAYNEFDVCDSVACQVYFGANTEDPISDEAIEETDGIIALDSDNNPILALYSSTAGGYTESYAFAFSDPQTREFPAKELHFLTATPDNKEFVELNSDEEAEKFYTSKPDAYDIDSPYYRWSKEWSVSELEEILAKTLPAQAKTGFVSPAIKEGEPIGKLKSIRALKRGKSGKIIELEISTEKTLFVVQKELVIRRCFPKKGISLPSANFVITYIDADEPKYKFFGGGFGHGVGLSQWGAGKMSSLGFSYDEILQHYYQGIKLATIPEEVSLDKNLETTFYTRLEDAFVYIKNPDKIKRLKVVINERELDIKLEEEMIIDISKYLKNGINHISYTITDETAQESQKITVFTQIKGAQNE